MMWNIETVPSKQMYPYLSLVEIKVVEFYHNIDRSRWLVWSKWLIFITFSGQFMVSLCAVHWQSFGITGCVQGSLFFKKSGISKTQYLGFVWVSFFLKSLKKALKEPKKAQKTLEAAYGPISSEKGVQRHKISLQ